VIVQKRAVLVSLRFNPAFVQHLIAYAKALHELGFEVEFRLAPEYKQFPELAGLAAVAADPGALPPRPYTHAVFLNVSAQHQQFAVRLKNSGARILYLYHEPWRSIWAYLKTDGISSVFRGAAAHRVSLPLLRISDVVLTGSQYALDAYRLRDIRHNRNVTKFQLIYDDEAGELTPEMVANKQYFSYVGNIGHVHAFDQYVDVMRESFIRNSGLRFLIASRMPLPGYFLRDKTIRSNLGRIKLLCGRTLQNSEINDCYARSFCVWNLYRRSTQSGVLPKAFMFGTPVIVSRIGSFPEFVNDGFNGRYASAGDLDHVLSIANELRENSAEYAKNCRSSFLETFFYRFRLEELRQLLA
jgi:glycosyltransferase involved in cell wall biosynthesis